MPELLGFAFMQRALLAALLVGVTAPVVGTYLVQRRLALIGDGIGHVALAGVAIGVLTGTTPVLSALVLAVLAASAIELIRTYGQTSADVALAVLFYGGIAAGVVLFSRSTSGAASLAGYLFGAITTTTGADLAVFVALGVGVVAVTWVLRPRLFAVANDEEYARATGMRVTGYNILLSSLTAVTVVMSMRVVGLLLISALMIVPNATAQILARSFAGTVRWAVAVGVACSVGGVWASYYLATPSGGTIVLLAIGVFVASAVVRSLLDRLRRAPAILVHDDHEHSPDCGHERVEHEGHVDYLHDGERHRQHERHYHLHDPDSERRDQAGRGGRG
ncbi:MAG TPA: metal ABC transporter permease [Dermatophilaceae bacterium]|nr:metal ABC transporter permease [Dermatophilaceae bacterium]